MNADAALDLMMAFVEILLLLSTPLLLLSLVIGVGVGILQTATQIQEASISYVAKSLALIGLLLVVGPKLFSHMVTYTKGRIHAIEEVVR